MAVNCLDEDAYDMVALYTNSSVQPKEQTINQLMDKCELDRETAESLIGE